MVSQRNQSKRIERHAVASYDMPWQTIAGHGSLRKQGWTMAGHGKPWQTMASSGRPWQEMAGHGKVVANHGRPWQGHGKPWPAMAGHSKPSPSMAGHGLPMPAMAGHGQLAMPIASQVQPWLAMARRFLLGANTTQSRFSIWGQSL